MSVTPESLGFISPDQVDLPRRVLRDEALQAEFDERGYVVVPLLDHGQVEQLRRSYLAAVDRPEGLNPEGAYDDTYAEFSVIHSRPSFRSEAFDIITEVLTEPANGYLSEFRPLVANFVNKPPGTGVVPAHQNWSVVDESRFQSVSVWVALVDCVVANGAMLMCDGSHKMLRGRRGMWAYYQFSNIESELIEQHLTPVAVSAGDAVILDDAVVHYSPPNTTDQARLAIQFVMVPDEAEAIFHQQVGADGDLLDVDVWSVDEAFFFNFWHGEGDPAFGKVVERRSVPAPLLTREQFEALISGGPLQLESPRAEQAVEALVDDAPNQDSARDDARPSLRSWLANRLRLSSP